MDLNNLLWKNRDNTTIAIVVLVSLLITKLLYGQQMVKYHYLEEQIRTEREKQKIVDHIIDLNKTIKKYKERNWDTTDFNSIVGKISNLALGSGVKIFDITPEGRKDENQHLVIPLAINGESTYKNLLRFLKSLETNKMILRVKSVHLSPHETEGAAGNELTIGVNLSVQAIYLK